MPPLAVERFVRAVDHTLLDAGAGARALDELCEQAAEHGFASVCVFPWWVERCARLLDGKLATCTVVSFPHGLDRTAVKCGALRAAIEAGAEEIDVVIAHGALRDGDDPAVAADLRDVVATARRHRGDVIVKAIVEAPLLDRDELERACRIVAASGADFAKSGTGTAGDVTVEQVRTMRAALPARVRVKASGGIRSAAAAGKLLDAGAERLGTSSAIHILETLDVNALA